MLPAPPFGVAAPSRRHEGIEQTLIDRYRTNGTDMGRHAHDDIVQRPGAPSMTLASPRANRHETVLLEPLHVQPEDVAIAWGFRREEYAPGQARKARELNPLVQALELLHAQVRAEGVGAIEDDRRVVHWAAADRSIGVEHALELAPHRIVHTVYVPPAIRDDPGFTDLVFTVDPAPRHERKHHRCGLHESTKQTLQSRADTHATTVL